MDFGPEIIGPGYFLFPFLGLLFGLVPLAIGVVALVFLIRISNTLERIEQHLAGGAGPTGAGDRPFAG